MSKSTLAAIILTTFAGAAFAAAPPFEDVDANTDGKVTMEEAAVVEGLDFTKADANQDGALDKDEYEAAIDAM